MLAINGGRASSRAVNRSAALNNQARATDSAAPAFHGSQIFGARGRAPSLMHY